MAAWAMESFVSQSHCSPHLDLEHGSPGYGQASLASRTVFLTWIWNVAAWAMESFISQSHCSPHLDLERGSLGYGKLR